MQAPRFVQDEDFRLYGTDGSAASTADCGSSMTFKLVALLLADLGITQSHARLRGCRDSEARFKILKYRSAFPARGTLHGGGQG